ncbi:MULTISPECIES: hypothetical protein [Aeromonas]|uniref:hypothetical protein n=1 Tax=Aeromonas TaxID=642 RepID=UPI0015DBF074|nr:hypothetical protein [Aeromonas jandaei]BBQ52346.1 hypothetical protein WP2S18C03_14270 [Aeromonas veronii]
MIEPIVYISPAFRGGLIPSDLFRTEATIMFDVSCDMVIHGGIIFHIEYEEFILSLSFQNNSIVFQRNDTVSVLELNEFIYLSADIRTFVIWSTSSITLNCGINREPRKHYEIKTKSVAPPVELLRWARKNSLLNKDIYHSEEEFRNRVYSSLSSINDKISEANAYKSFWNIEYKGQKIISRKPKIEVDLQPVIHCMLSDQMLLSNIEIIPEYGAGVGNIDFVLIASVKDRGMVRLCVEFKLAHSKDLAHGLIQQLPAYMASTKSKYGAYCILSFKGEWFDKPNIGDDIDIQDHVNKISIRDNSPVLDNIRTFIFDMTKPITASKI